jgi:hypothetical protein
MLLLANLLLILGPFAAQGNLLVPISKCLANHPEVVFTASQSPPFLRLHFRRAGEPDFVVAVLVRRTHSTHALVCGQDGTGVLLGAAGEQPFSDMADDNYMSDEWSVCTRKHLRKMRKFYTDVPDPENEGVLLTWEDGQALIYWDGKQFRWKSLKP